MNRHHRINIHLLNICLTYTKSCSLLLLVSVDQSLPQLCLSVCFNAPNGEAIFDVTKNILRIGLSYFLHFKVKEEDLYAFIPTRSVECTAIWLVGQQM